MEDHSVVGLAWVVARRVCDAICQEWYPLFESHFLFGTILDDFSLQSRIICPDHDFRIGEYRYFRKGSIGVYRNGLSKRYSGLIMGDLNMRIALDLFHSCGTWAVPALLAPRC